MKRNKGFTLIELLVVIAIIGILSSVVLASLSSARSKGKDASVKSQMASLKAQGELFYSEKETFGASATADNVCSTVATDNGFYDLLIATQDVSGVLDGAKRNADASPTSGAPDIFNSAAGTFETVTCHTIINDDYTSAWAAEAPLSDSADGAPVMYCSDSTGVSRITTSNLSILEGDNFVTCPEVVTS